MPLTLSKEQLDAQIDLIKATTGLNPLSPTVISEYFLRVVQFLDERAKLAEDFVSETNSSTFIQESILQAEAIRDQAESYALQADAIRAAAANILALNQGERDAILLAVANVNLGNNPLGEYNATTNVPALTAIPPAAPGVPIGSFYNVTVAGSLAFAGSNFASGQAVVVGGRVIKKSETQWYYINPSDLAKQLADQNRTELDKITEDTTGVLKRMVTTPMPVVTRDAANAIIANRATTKQSISIQREISITGYDDSADSYQEMFSTGIATTGYKSFEFTGTYLSSKSANPYIGFGFEAAGETIGIMYRVDGRIGWLGTNTSSGGVQTILANDPDRALVANDVVTIIATLTSVNVAVQVFKNGVLKSTFIIAKVATGNIVLSSRGSAIYKCTIVSNKSVTTIGSAIAAANTNAKEYADGKINPIIRASLNLMPSDFTADSSFSNSTGAIIASANGKRTTNLISVLPSTTYTLININTAFPGNEYKASVASADNRVQVIAPVVNAPSVYNILTFTTSPTTTHLGINVRTSGFSDTSANAMLVQGTVTSTIFEAFAASFLKGDQIRGDIAGYAKTTDLTALKTYSDVFVTYNPVGYHSSITGNDTEQFLVYTRLGQRNSTYYAGFKVVHMVNAAIKQDLWKITGADLYTYNGTNMSAAGINLLNPSESEFAYQRQGAWDHTGGYHGNEKIITADFFIDSIRITDLTVGFSLIPCKDFVYIQKSNMLRTAATSSETIADSVENEHGKKTWFKAGGYKTNNVLQWKEAGLTILKAYPGIVTVGLPVSAKFRIGSLNPEITATHASSAGVQYRGNVGDREVLYYHPDNSIGAKISSEIKRVLSGPTWGTKDGVNMIISYSNNNTLAYDMACMQRVWDNNAYAKYYRELEGKVTTLDELWELECEVDFFRVI